ncbi:MAG: sarcosine oxidase subunit alpha family protein [Pseudomonadales bacterium]|nr:sarcosine oxidase subunit alpha family protein [Pseudomonadales bacterium]
MSGYRLSNGAGVDRTPLSFTFNGRRLNGYLGDTLASALIANGIDTVARGFKYHRPRGVFGIGMEEPNALVRLRNGGRWEPNTQATLIELFDGLEAASENVWPSVDFDVMAINSLFSKFFVAGFYYKTFMGPTGKNRWMFFENFIRKAAGLGEAAKEADPDRYEHENLFCDVLVVGAGLAGLAAARVAAATGARVVVAELLSGVSGDTKILAELQSLSNVTLLLRTLVYGYYDTNTLGAVERVADHLAKPAPYQPRQRHWTIRAEQVVLTTGALERPPVFAGNDRPGVMLATAAAQYVTRYGVAPGRKVLVFTNNNSAYDAAWTMHDNGVSIVALVDSRKSVQQMLKDGCDLRGIRLLTGQGVVRTKGRKRIKAVDVKPLDGGDTQTIIADTLAVSSGWNPNIQLQSQAGGAPVYDESIAAFVSGPPTEQWTEAGACCGEFDPSSATVSGHNVGLAAALACGHPDPGMQMPTLTKAKLSYAIEPLWEVPVSRGKAFIDFQHDVCSDDVRLAHREGYVSVEHMKRYTTLGMACDQGRTANVNALSIMAKARGVSIPQAGTTRFRAPLAPVSLGSLAGRGIAANLQPVRRTAMHDWHMANGAEMIAAGLWMRPRAYLQAGETMTDAYIREAGAVRNSVGIVDVSTLGKIDILGPDAAEFLNRIYTNAFLKLPIGKARYGVMLREDGVVFDDGTTWRLDEARFLMTTTTANAANVLAFLERMLDTVWPNLRVSVSSSTEQWASMAVAGPNSRKVLAKILDDIEMDNEAFPFMGVRKGHLDGIEVLVARLSFSGEMAYEVFTPAHSGLPVWERIISAGEEFNILPYGMEALGTLRIEKGHVAGAELDGRRSAKDLGLEGMASKKKAFVGSVLKHREAFLQTNREVLVGLKSISGEVIPTGSHLVTGTDAEPGESQGNISSTTYSPAMRQQIALGFLSNGRERIGEVLYATYPLKNIHIKVEVVSPHFFDPDGGRMRV